MGQPKENAMGRICILLQFSGLAISLLNGIDNKGREINEGEGRGGE